MLMLASGCGMRTRVITPDSEEYESIPLFAQCLIEAYPNEIVGYADNHLVWNDGTRYCTTMVSTSRCKKCWKKVTTRICRIGYTQMW